MEIITLFTTLTVPGGRLVNRSHSMLTVQNSVLLVVDVQERLFPLVHQKENLLKNLTNIIKSAQILGVPILWTEQAPQKIGKTISFISGLLNDLKPIEKVTFSCCGDVNFVSSLGVLERRQILLTGIEAHVCVYQTAQDLIRLGYDVYAVADAISSRTAENKQIGLERIRESGGSITSTETAVCELLKVAEGEKFKEIIKLIK